MLSQGLLSRARASVAVVAVSVVAMLAAGAALPAAASTCPFSLPSPWTECYCRCANLCVLLNRYSSLHKDSPHPVTGLNRIHWPDH